MSRRPVLRSCLIPALSPLVMALMALWPLESLAQRAARPVAPSRDAIPVPAASWRLQGTGADRPTETRNPLGGRDQRIDQTSRRAIYQWQSFDIGADSKVHFQLPSADSSALNRIDRGASPSAIFGALTSNGSITLLNGSGILFGAGAQVNVNGLIASTLNVGDDDFLQGLTTSIYSGSPSFFKDAAFLGVPVVGKGFVEVQAGASIRTEAGGRVFLFA